MTARCHLDTPAGRLRLVAYVFGVGTLIHVGFFVGAASIVPCDPANQNDAQGHAKAGIADKHDMPPVFRDVWNLIRKGKCASGSDEKQEQEQRDDKDDTGKSGPLFSLLGGERDDREQSANRSENGKDRFHPPILTPRAAESTSGAGR